MHESKTPGSKGSPYLGISDKLVPKTESNTAIEQPRQITPCSMASCRCPFSPSQKMLVCTCG